MADYTKEFLEFETISKLYANNFLNNYFNIDKNANVSSKMRLELERIYILYEYLDYKCKGGLKIKENELCNFLRAVGKSNYVQTIVDYCKLCGKFTRDSYEEKFLVKYIMNYDHKKYNDTLGGVQLTLNEPQLIYVGRCDV